MTAHPLAVLLDAAGRGSFPASDGMVEVVPAPPGRASALIGFTGHWVLAADLDPAAVAARCPPGDFSAPMSPLMLTWIADELRSRPATFDALLVATATGAGRPAWLREIDASDHPRVQRASRYRTDIRLFRADDAVLVVGRGICGRWEIGYEVDASARNAGLGRRIVRAALDAIPAGEHVWAQVAPGNAASMRTTIGGGFVPVAAEVLFPT